MSNLIYLLSPLKQEGSIFLPMIFFKNVVKKIDFSKSDALLFTSKQAVESANEIDETWKSYPSIAIGEATKKRIEELGGTVIYTPSNFYGKVLAEEIKEYFSDRKILYLRPKKVSFDSQAHLAQYGIVLEEQIIYETGCKGYLPEQKPDENAIIIFTSPSTIHCFFKNFSWDKSYTAVLIGEATKVHLPDYCDYVIADEPLIRSCMEKAFSLKKG